MRVTAAMERVSKGSKRKRTVKCRTFLIMSSFNEDDETKSKAKKDKGPKGKGKKKKKKGSDMEGFEDSDDGDFEGLEVDYMSDESR